MISAHEVLVIARTFLLEAQIGDLQPVAVERHYGWSPFLCIFSVALFQDFLLGLSLLQAM